MPLLNALLLLLLFAPAFAGLRDHLWVMGQMRSRVPVPLRDELALKFALDGFVLQEHTPLAIRRAYVRSHAYDCVFVILITVLVVLNGAVLPACLFGAVSLLAVLTALSEREWARA